MLDLLIAVNQKDSESKQVRKVVFDWKEAGKVGYLKPEDGRYQKWFTQRGLYQSREQVIFLGQSYSEMNSICWRLKIGSPSMSKDKAKSPLYTRLSE